ncbi:MAG: hypothetical protein ACREA9_15035 [Pyrinomonadaceae bacterium]
MPRPECSPQENILRAIHEAFWDLTRDRKSSSIFKGTDISVSRLSILGLNELFAIFHRKLDGSPNGRIVAGGEINIGNLQRIGREFIPNRTELAVEEDPEPDNRAHAVIPQKISPGLAKTIIEALIIHEDPDLAA